MSPGVFGSVYKKGEQMKRLIPFSAVLCACLLAGLGWVVSHPQKAAAHAVFDDHENDRDHDRDKDKDDKDKDKDHDRDCDQDRDQDRDKDRDKDRDDKDRDSGHDADRDHSRNDDHKHGDGNVMVGSFLTTIVNYGTGGVASRSVITLHRDRTMSVIDSGQGGPGTEFSSQLGAWKRGCDGSAKGRTLDFSFPPNAGIARVDYKFDGDQPKDTIKGTIVLTTFPLNSNPLDGGGTVVGHFEFTGQRIKGP
jgi:hypothetical protein